MTIRWDKFVRPDRGKLLFAGILIFASAAAMLFFYFSKETIKSKGDITYINGPFEQFSWINSGKRSGSSLTFQLQNYSNKFKIKADFFTILQKDKFRMIPYGDTLTIGIPNRFVKYLNKPRERFFVYSISSKDFIYLDLNKVISKHNSQLLLFAAGLFLIGGCVLIYFGRKVKQKTSI